MTQFRQFRIIFLLVFVFILLLFSVGFVNAQNITNTLGSLGTFRIKDNSVTFLSLDQTNGNLSLNRSLNLLNTTSGATGVIMKNSVPFIHDYTSPGTDGNNTFVGINSGNFSMGGVISTYGSYNTALGKNTMARNTTGSYNTSVGYLTLNQNTTGLLNTAIGTHSLNLNVSGSFNTSLGASTLYNNISGSRNIAIGTYALVSNTSGTDNVAIGYQSQNAITDNTGNTSVGSFTLNHNIASNNSAFGLNSLLSNTYGDYNSAYGVNSLRSNTDGDDNTSMGTGSMYSNTIGNLNSAFGEFSLYNNINGYGNTAIGGGAIYSNVSGSYNSALGIGALGSNSNGQYNSAVGTFSLSANTSGSNNSSLGNNSLNDNTSGSKNTALGSESGSTVTTGSNITVLGYDSEPSSSSVNNQITLGNNQVTSLRCNVTTITSLSDARDKKNIHDLNLGLDFISKLKPRLYNWDKREWYENNVSDGSKMQEMPTAGFIAQELDELQASENAEWLNLVLKDNPEKLEATTGNLLPVMVKAIQELKAKCDALESENKFLLSENKNNEKLQLQVEVLSDRLNELSKITEELKNSVYVNESKNLEVSNEIIK